MLRQVIERTWASVEVEETSVVFYEGGSKLRSSERRLFLPVRDDLPNVGRKTLACFEHVLERKEFDVVFRTNCSSYVDLPNLRRFVDGHARDQRFYAGSIRLHDGIAFASGSGYFLSRDLVELVVALRDGWDHSLLDDVALGALLAQQGIAPGPAPRRDYRSPAEVGTVDTEQFHFRCRTDSRGRLGDARIMVALHRAFCDARGRRVPATIRAVERAERLWTSLARRA